jgi:transcriptional regulator with XRE-family HTH domain
MQLYDKIRVIRELKNWTQEEMAHRLEMSISGYGSIERGETDVNFSRLEKIAKAFGMDLVELFSFGEKLSIYQTNNSGNNFGQFCNPKLDNLSEKLELIIQQKDKEIEYLKQQILDLRQQNTDLREINQLLKEKNRIEIC